MNVLLIETDSADARTFSSFLKEQGHLCFITDSAKSAKSMVKKEYPGLVLMHLNGNTAQTLDFLDTARNMDPPVPVIVLTRKPKLDDAVQAVKNGAYDFWTKPFPMERLSSTIDLIESRKFEPEIKATDDVRDSIITRDPVLQNLKALAKKIAPSNATVFIQGESGTGKELFARYIHLHGGRHDKPFVALNCAALPETLLESELFGYEKGAFTGAIRNREGKFELAHTGTLLLDEVTEIPLHLQAKLLRVLQESEVDRLGGKYPVPVDVRVVATTNVRIEDQVKEGKFRKDLYYRLNVIPLRIPPLRERASDIVPLAQFFLEKYSSENGSLVNAFEPDALAKLKEHSWPGNVRELQNVVQRAVLIAESSGIALENITLDEDGQDEGTVPGLSLMPLSELEKMMIHKALSTFEGNRTKAAEILGISVRTLRNKLHEYRQTIEM
jgi:two-component system response regulator FlrC